MKLKVLGSSSKGNCYILEDEKNIVIIDCGISYREILKGIDFNLAKVKFALSGHSHADHSKAIIDLMKNGVDVYVSKETATELNLSGYRLKIIKELKQFNVGEFMVLPFDLHHDVHTLGFIIQHKSLGKLIYATDTSYIEYKFSGLNHILIEANYSKEILEKNIENGFDPVRAERIVRSHFSLENVKELVKANDNPKLKNVVLLHLSDGNSNAKEFKEQIHELTNKAVYVADKGLEIELGGTK